MSAPLPSRPSSPARPSSSSRPSSPSESLTEEQTQAYLVGLTPFINDLFTDNTCSDLTVGLTEIGQRFTFVRGKDGTLVPITVDQETPAHDWMLLFCYSKKTGMQILDTQESPTPTFWLLDLKEKWALKRGKGFFNKLLSGS